MLGYQAAVDLSVYFVLTGYAFPFIYPSLVSNYTAFTDILCIQTKPFRLLPQPFNHANAEVRTIHPSCTIAYVEYLDFVSVNI